MPNIRVLLLAAFIAVFFVSGVQANEPAKACLTLEDILAKAGNDGQAMPERTVRLPEHPNMVLLVFADGSGLALEEDENTCILGKAMFGPVEMEKILPQLQSW